MSIIDVKRERNRRKVLRVRKKISGSKSVPRIAVTQTNKNLYIQVIDDLTGRTILSVSSQDKDLKLKSVSKKNVKVAEMLAEKLAGKLQEGKISKIVLDRRVKKYHGIIKVFSEKLREKGMKF